MNHFIVSMFLMVLHVNLNYTVHAAMWAGWIDEEYDDGSWAYEPPKKPVESYSNEVPYNVMPEPCQGQNYCFEKAENYPIDLIEKALAEFQSLPHYFKRPQKTTENRKKIDYRQGVYKADCPAETTDDPIYYIVDTNNNTRVVIQSPKLTQLYTVRKCLNEGRITSETAHFLNHKNELGRYNLQCKTFNTETEFYVLDDSDSTPKLDKVLVKNGIPVCCKCVHLE